MEIAKSTKVKSQEQNLAREIKERDKDRNFVQLCREG